VLIYPKKTSLAARLHLEVPLLIPVLFPARCCNCFSFHLPFLLQGYPDNSDEDMLLDFIRFLLDLDPAGRPSATDALDHPWLSDADTVDVYYEP
jgi:serine/threonine protein kinase